MQTAPSLNIDPVSLRADAALTGCHDVACSVCSDEIALSRRHPGAEQCFRVDASSGLGSALGFGLSRNGLPRPLAAGTAATSARAAHGIGFDGATKTSALGSNSVAVMGAHCAGPSDLADPPAGHWPVGPEYRVSCRLVPSFLGGACLFAGTGSQLSHRFSFSNH